MISNGLSELIQSQFPMSVERANLFAAMTDPLMASTHVKMPEKLALMRAIGLALATERAPLSTGAAILANELHKPIAQSA